MQKYLYRLRFSRTGKLRFLSHQEQIELIRRSIRRASLPVSFTEGFHPQLKISFGPAISVGYESNCELADVETYKLIDTREFAKKLISKLPEGFALVEIKRIPSFFGAIETVANLCEYSIKNLDYFIPKSEIEILIKEFLNRKEFIVEFSKKDKIQQFDIIPLVKEMFLSDTKLILKLRFGPKRNIKVERIIESIFKLGEEVKSLKICREMLYLEKSDGSIMKL